MSSQDLKDIVKTFAIGALSGFILFKLVKLVDFKDYLGGDNVPIILAGGMGALGAGTVAVLSQPGIL